jgi:tetratricopeptide (TPR) repeat protein
MPKPLVLIWLVGLTWGIGTLTLATETMVARPGAAGGLVPYLLLSGGSLAGYLLLHLLLRVGAPGAERSGHLLVLYYLVLLALLTAWAYILARRAAAAAPSGGRLAWLYPLAIGLAMVAAFLTNVNEVRGDIVYKQAWTQWHATATSQVSAGNVEEARRYYAEAQRDYERAIALDPSEDFYRLFRGKARLEEADAVAQQLEAAMAQELDPSDRSAPDFSEYEAAAGSPTLEPLLRERDQLFERAVEILDRARQMAPLNTDHWANLGRAYQVWGDRTFDPARRAERLELSREWFTAAIGPDLSPKNAGLRDEMAMTEFLDDRPEAALERVAEAMAIDPDYGRPYRTRAEIQRAEGDLEAAAEDYERYLETGEGRADVAAWSAYALVLGRQQRYEEARAANEHVLELLGGEDLPTLRNLAIIARDMGEPEAGCEYVERGLAVRDDPGLQQLAAELGCAPTAASPAGAVP